MKRYQEFCERAGRLFPSGPLQQPRVESLAGNKAISCITPVGSPGITFRVPILGCHKRKLVLSKSQEGHLSLQFFLLLCALWEAEHQFLVYDEGTRIPALADKAG